MLVSRVHLLWNGRKQPASTVGSVRRPAAWMQSAPWTEKSFSMRKNVNNCGRCVKACPTDAWKATPAFEVSFGGLFGNRVYKGENYLPLVTSEEQLFRITDAAIQFFDDNANPGERFRMTLERVGLDKFEEKIKEAYNG